MFDFPSNSTTAAAAAAAAAAASAAAGRVMFFRRAVGQLLLESKTMGEGRPWVERGGASYHGATQCRQSFHLRRPDR